MNDRTQTTEDDSAAAPRRDPPVRPAEPDRPDVAELERRIVHGDREALAALFSMYRPRLWRMVNFRLHAQLQGRVDPDDVLQEAWLRAAERIGYFLREASHSSFIWFRMIVIQTLIELHRRHLGARKRSAALEFSIDSGWSPGATSSCLAFHLSGTGTSPSSALGRAERAQQLEAALQALSELDREVLALRHFEELTNAETARVLNVSEQGASARYVRALGRLKLVLEALPGFREG